jgi:cytochrome c553
MGWLVVPVGLSVTDRRQAINAACWYRAAVRLHWLAIGLAATAATAGAQSAQTLDYNRDVRALLSDRCFACHGPDAAQRKADLRLDTREGAAEVLANGELLRRLHSTDPDEMMPPPALKRPLDGDERHKLVRWIEEGAVYQPHWAFVAPQAAVAADATRDPVDTLIAAQLEAQGLTREPEAEARVLLRRVSMVLTGLPPTPEQADAYAANPTNAAYEAHVDALLASPAAAEHMASVWLDLARYADTHGFQTDGPAFTWPWRDWLLEALRTNKPYDQFITDVLAGDLKPQATVADRVATAFQRLHRTTEEGGSIPEEFRQEAIADRVGTFGTAFLGLTLDCARCHDHKYDPVPMSDYYALAAMFGALDENGLKPFSLPGDAPPPFVRLATPEQEAQERVLAAAVQSAADFWSATRAAALARVQAPDESLIALPAPAAHYPFDVLENGITPNAIREGKPAHLDRHRPEQLGTVELVASPRGQALRLDGDGGVWLEQQVNFGRHEAVTLSLWLRPGERNVRAAIVHASGFHTQDADASGIELELVDGHVRWSAIHRWPGSAASIQTRTPLELEQWTHVVASYNGSSSASGLRLYVNGAPADTQVVRDHLDGPLAGNALEVGSRSRGMGFRNGQLDELRVWRRALTQAEAQLVARADGIALEPLPAEVRLQHAAEHDAEVVTARDAWRAAQRTLAAHLDAIPAFVCMQDSPWARPTYVLRRGAYDQPDTTQPMQPGAVPAVLPFDESLPKNRMGLVRWLVDPRHPLTARVQVNRLWMQVFGTGLVDTPENFGMQGNAPKLQSVLDQLAVDFRTGAGVAEQRWNNRYLLKRLVMSATFRQSSRASSTKRAVDPLNALWSRGPATRVSAEMLRDLALEASGQRNERWGGPSSKPWQPEGLWHEAGQIGNYVPDMGPDARRRALYTYRKRTVPPPNMSAWDAGPREACVARRSATTTPLQSLTIFNDRVYLDTARATARRVMREANTTAARIERLYRLVCTTQPNAAELAAVSELVRTQTARFATVLPDAAKLCGAEDAELAALVLACSTLYASDGALVVR